MYLIWRIVLVRGTYISFVQGILFGQATDTFHFLTGRERYIHYTCVCYIVYTCKHMWSPEKVLGLKNLLT